jgi:hypothetical protein
MIKRWIQGLIEKDLKEKSCVILVGSRRAGKTTLVRNIESGNQIYLTMDDVDYQELFSKDPKSLEDYCDKQKLNVIDEIQKCPQVFDTVKLLIDRKYKFILTGSSALGLLEKASLTLAGRMRIRELPTLCFGEEAGEPETHKIGNPMKADLNIKKGQRKFKKSYLFGGYPEVVLEKNDESKTNLLKDYKNSYLQRDILELSEIQNLDAFRALVSAMAASIGSVTNYHNFSKESGLSFVTTKKYIHSLEQTFIIFKVFPFMFGPAKRFIKSPKWYFTDQGLLKSLGIELSEGQLFENFAMNQIRKNIIVSGGDPANLLFYKTQAGAEIDLIVDTGKRKYAFEIKSKQRIDSKDIINLRAFLENEKSFHCAFVISKGQSIEKIDDKITVIPVSFLYKRLLLL